MACASCTLLWLAVRTLCTCPVRALYLELGENCVNHVGVHTMVCCTRRWMWEGARRPSLFSCHTASCEPTTRSSSGLCESWRKSSGIVPRARAVDHTPGSCSHPCPSLIIMHAMDGFRLVRVSACVVDVALAYRSFRLLLVSFHHGSGRHVVIIAQRTILGKSYARSTKTQGPRPRSRTLTAVQDAMLEVINKRDMSLTSVRATAAPVWWAGLFFSVASVWRQWWCEKKMGRVWSSIA